MNNLRKSSVVGCAAVVQKLLSIMKMAGRKSYAQWVNNINQSVANHEDENNKFLYEAEGLVVLNEITSQDKVQDFVSSVLVKNAVTNAVKTKCNIKVVPISSWHCRKIPDVGTVGTGDCYA